MRVWKWQKVGGTCKRGALVGGGGWGEEGGCRGSVGYLFIDAARIAGKGLRSAVAIPGVGDGRRVVG